MTAFKTMPGMDESAVERVGMINGVLERLTERRVERIVPRDRS